jgi:prepilin-type N-terminal cleavage/methylation domain-containing protein
MPSSPPSSLGRSCSVHRRPNGDGFTLIEILIAIVLVGVLSGVAVIGITNLMSKGSASACAASADSSRAASAVYLATYGTYPADFGALTTATGSGGSALPAALALPAGVTVSGLVASPTSGAWTVTMTAGTTTAPPTFVCTGAVTSTLRVAWPVLPSGQVGTVYAATNMPVSLGTSPYAWMAPGLPRGMGLGPTSGTVYGTPTAAGTFLVTFAVTDAAGATVSKGYPLTVLPATAPCPDTIIGWKGEYFGTLDLSGPPAICRDDSAVNFDWASAAPGPGLPMDGFSVRWTGSVTSVGGAYTFTLGTDDGGRLYIDGTLVLSRWIDQVYPATPPSVTRTLAAGAHPVVVEYYDRTAIARATLVVTPPT